ncbi:MAG: diacylglycerol/lipid kinase family protein [Actinomycetota bacterium]
MSSPYGEATAIIGFDITGKLAMPEQRARQLLEQAGIEFSLQAAERAGEASELARRAVEQGSGFIVCVGDDWSMHEVINGVMGETGPINPDLVLSVLPVSDGSDFLRTMGLAEGPEDSIHRLATEPWFAIDVVRITWAPPTQPDHVYFVNMAQAGMAGEMARRRRSLPKSLGRVGDLLAFWLALGRFKVPKGAVRVDKRSYGGPIVNLVVANGQFHRDGVRMAAKAHPGDGKLDVLIQKGTKRDFIDTMTRSLKGEHLPSGSIKEYLSARVEIQADIPLPVDVDGRMLGHTPAIFEVVPHAVRLKI